MVAFAFLIKNVVYLVVIGFMVVAMVGATLGTTISQRRGAKRRWERTRTRYQEQIGAARDQAERANAVQRAALDGLFPDPGLLATVFEPDGGLWERRPGDRDFGHVRLGLGSVPASRRVATGAGTAAPSERPDPDLTAMIDEARSETAFLVSAPVTIPLSRLGTVAVVGSRDGTQRVVGAWLASLAAFHAPGELRIAGWVPPEAERTWDWLKWLPHCRDPQGGAGLGRADRAVSTDLTRFEKGVEQLAQTREDSGTGEHVVVVVDGWHPDSPVAGIEALGTVIGKASTIAVTVIVLAHSARDVPSVCGAQVTLAVDGSVSYVEAGPGGRVETGVIADQLDPAWVAQFARRMAPLRLVSGGVSTEAADSSRLVELLGSWENGAASTPLGLNDEVGVDPPQLLAAPIGVTEYGGLLTLDLKEAAAGGMGPHGILVGATGSGKSEMLRSLCASLAWRHEPSLLNMLLIDFKGGAAFAELGTLPHSAGLITNLADQTALITRVSQALDGELTRRQEMLRTAGNLSSISEYHKAQMTDRTLPSLPYLVVVVDEFGELLAAAPAFLDTFVAIGRLGRSLGIHLLLATQRLDEGRIHGLEPHLRYRLCLRTNTPAESRSVLGSTAAYELPSFPGLGLLQVDGTLHHFKSAIVSLPRRDTNLDDSTGQVCRVLSLSPPPVRPAPAESPASRDNNTRGPTDLHLLVSRCQARTKHRATPVWLNPLPDAVTVGALDPDVGRISVRRTRAAIDQAPTGRTPTNTAATDARNWEVPLGLIDQPATRSYETLRWDLTAGGGNLGVAGSPRSGKTTLLTTAIMGLALRHRPDEVQIYILDLAGAGLTKLADLPHVGAIVGRQPEAADGLVSELRAVVAERVAGPNVVTTDDRARIVLVIDGAGTLRQTMPDVETAIADLAVTGLAQGVHVAVATNRWIDLRPQLLDALGTRIELHLGDPADSMLNRSLALTVPADRPGRGLTRSGHLFQAALPDLAKTARAMTADAALIAAIDAARQRAGQLHAPAVTSLPLHVTEPELAEFARRAGSSPPDPRAGFVLGMAEVRSRPVQLDLTAPGANLVIYGDPGSGRTTLIRRITAHFTSRGDFDVYLIDPRRTSIDLASSAKHYAPSVASVEKLATEVASRLADRQPSDDLTLDQLQAGRWWEGPDIVVIIDDYDLASAGMFNPVVPLCDPLLQSADVGFHVVVARRVTGSSRSGFEAFSQRLKEITPVTLVLSGPTDEGPLVSGVTAKPRPPGRAVLVTAGTAMTVQLCDVAPPLTTPA